MSIQNKFESIGARVRVAPARDTINWRYPRHGPARPVRHRADPLRIDVGRDKRGEFFDLVVRDDVELDVLQADPHDRHLLLLARFEAEKTRYLCGHDERHWFVAAVPESEPVSSVEGAKAALRPFAIDVATRSRKGRGRRRSSSFVRQGEWFFVPAPGFEPGPLDPVRRHEPIIRGRGGTPHVADEAVRIGGTLVYLPQIPWDPEASERLREDLDRQFGRGVSEERMRVLRRQHPKWLWTSMLRDPELYVRGAVRHPDHATVALRGWHGVLMNREAESKALAHVAFFD